jgi:Gluconate 2-dehydrogenase subunit 3
MQRRELLISAGSLLSAGAVWAAVRKLPAGALPPGADAESREFVELMCDIVIPDSDTPGARRAGVPAFFFVALAHGLAGTEAADLGRLREQVRVASGKQALKLDRQELQTLIAGIDAGAYQDKASVWPRLKRVVIMGYYTSQIGASQELQYSPVPGRFDPDVPVTLTTRASSNDWVGQQF